MVKNTIILLVLNLLQFYISSAWGKKYITKLNKKIKAGARAAYFQPPGAGAAWKKKNGGAGAGKNLPAPHPYYI